MSEPIKADGTAVPVEPAIVVPAPEPPKPGKDGDITMPKAAFDARLERERTAWMKELGVDSIDKVKSAIATANAAAEAQKSDAEKAASAKTALEQAESKNKALADTIAEIAKANLVGLTDEQKAQITELAGEDPALQIKTFNVLKKSWGAAPVVAAKSEVAPVVGNTAPITPAPKDKGTPGSAPDPKAVHAELKKTNPYFAARYAVANGIHPSA